MSFYTWALTDGVWSFRETTKWVLGSQNLYVLLGTESMDVFSNAAALAEPFLASFLKEVSCMCHSPPVITELMEGGVSKMRNTHTLNENKTGKRRDVLVKLPLRAAFHQMDHAEQSQVLHVLKKLQSVFSPLRYLKKKKKKANPTLENISEKIFDLDTW